jgi:acyl carrier protein
MNTETIKQAIKEIIVNELDAGIKLEDFNEGVPLYNGGLGLDSISIINFIVLLEKKFDIFFSESEISSELFNDIDNLTDFVKEKLQTKVPV